MLCAGCMLQAGAGMITASRLAESTGLIFRLAVTVYRQPGMVARIRPGAGRAGERLQSKGKGQAKRILAGGRDAGSAEARRVPAVDTLSSMRRKAGVWPGLAPGVRGGVRRVRGGARGCAGVRGGCAAGWP